MSLTTRQHAGAALVAAAVVAAALTTGLFYPKGYAVGSIVVWSAVLAGLVSRALPFARVAAPAAMAGLCLAGVVVLAGVSIAWASDQGRAFEEAVQASAYLGLFTLAACTASPRGRSAWLAGMTGGLAIVSALAVASRLQPGVLENKGLLELIPDSGSRLSYPIGYWNGLGALLVAAAILLVHSGARAPVRELRASAIAAVPIVALGLRYATSRGAVLALVLGLVVLVAASPNRARQLRAIVLGTMGGGAVVLATSGFHALTDGMTDATARSQGDWATAILLAGVVLTGALAWFMDGREMRLRVPRAIAIGLAVVGVGAVAAGIAIADPAERFRDFKQPPPATPEAPYVITDDDFSGSGRWQLWGEALDAFESAPIAGIGAGGFEDWWAQHAPIFLFARSAHSLPLQQMAELGLLGALLLLGFLAAVIAAARSQLIKRTGEAEALGALLVAALATAATDWSWEIPVVLAPALVAAGLLTAAVPSPEHQRHSYVLGLGAVAIAWLAMVAAGLVLLTELKLDQSRSAAREGRLNDGIDRAQEARQIQPWSPEPYTQLALLEEARGNLDLALERLGQAEARDSEDWRLPLIESRLLFEAGDKVAGESAFDRARALNPRAPYLGGTG
jgi:O-Antigen ligase